MSKDILGSCIYVVLRVSSNSRHGPCMVVVWVGAKSRICDFTWEFGITMELEILHGFGLRQTQYSSDAWWVWGEK